MLQNTLSCNVKVKKKKIQSDGFLPGSRPTPPLFAFLTVRWNTCSFLSMQWECVHTYRHISSPYVSSLASLAFLAQDPGLSGLAWELGGLSSPFLFFNSLVPFFGALLLLLLAASSLMGSPTTDGLLFRFTSLPLFPPPAVRFCCFLLQGDWPLSWKTGHKNDWWGATRNI